MSEEKKRGRPPMHTFTDSPDRSRRAAVNMQYAINATATITSNAQQIPNHELLWFTDDEKRIANGKWGVLEQLGRMGDQDHLNQDFILRITQLSAQALKTGHTSREVETAIRRIRMAAKGKKATGQKSELRMAIFLLEVMSSAFLSDTT